MVLIFAETWNGQFKKSTFEAVRYGAECAKAQGSQAIAVVVGACDPLVETLGAYGAAKVVHLKGSDRFEPHAYAGALSALAAELGATQIVVSGTANGKSLAGVLAAKAHAGCISNVTALPSSYSPLTVQRSAFSSKGIEQCSSATACTVLVLVPNALGTGAAGADQAAAEDRDVAFVGKSTPGAAQVASGKIPLPEAERVVSAGRGLKGPDNWGMVEELAAVLNAGTACSKPVSDIGWRPHSEHVGQTGIQINPQLYIAIGISGAIQHLAGVSGSKTIVVINNDPEAPFFKAADYGIVGDAFDVLPRLTAALKAHLN